jgi:hypothetical protein
VWRRLSDFSGVALIRMGILPLWPEKLLHKEAVQAGLWP